MRTQIELNYFNMFNKNFLAPTSCLLLGQLGCASQCESTARLCEQCKALQSAHTECTTTDSNQTSVSRLQLPSSAQVNRSDDVYESWDCAGK
jgi:hypothetical protein